MEEREVLDKCHGRCATSKNTGLFAPCKCRCRGRYHGVLTLKSMRRQTFVDAKKSLDTDLKHAMQIVVDRAAAAVQLRIKQSQEKVRAIGR